jgi:hypothetical protein
VAGRPEHGIDGISVELTRLGQRPHLGSRVLG